MPLHTRGTPVCTSTAKPNMAKSSRPTADGVGGQRGQPVAAEDQAPGAHQAGHADAGGEELEHDQGQADDEEQVGHRRAGDGVEELAAERELAEAGLGDGLALAVDDRASRRPGGPRPAARRRRTRRWSGPRCPPGPGRRPRRRSPCRPPPPRRRGCRRRAGPGDLHPAAAGDTPTMRAAASSSVAVAGGLAARGPDPHVHGHVGGRRCARPARRGGRRSTTAPALLSCRTRAMAPSSSASAICVSTKSTSTSSSSPLTSMTAT